VFKRTTHILVVCMLFVLVAVVHGSPTRAARARSAGLSGATSQHGKIAPTRNVTYEYGIYDSDLQNRSKYRKLVSMCCAITSELFESAVSVQSAPRTEQPEPSSAAVVAAMSARAPPWAKKERR
jgi:hypothetical protein